MKELYFASPYGFSEAGRFFMYEKMFPIIEAKGFKILDPWKLTPQEDLDKVLSLPYGKEQRGAWENLNPSIGDRNFNAIQQANGLIAILDGTDVDSGTACEIGYAAALGKPILGYRGDFRLAADNPGSLVNLQVERGITLNGGKIITSLDQLKESLELF